MSNKRNRRRLAPAPTSSRAHGDRPARLPPALAGVPTEPSTPQPLGGVETAVGYIATGALDPHLSEIMRAIHERQRHLARTRSVQALARVSVGDRVRLTRDVRPYYLHGATGTVIGWSGQRVSVLLDVPIGRFTHGELTCPPLGLERLSA